MIFWIFVVLLIFAIILHIYFDNIMTYILSILSAIIVCLLIAIIIGQHILSNNLIERDLERYKAICYKIDSYACRDEFGLLGKEVIDEIQEWNEDVVYYQNIQDDFWVGIFYPNIFDIFETIDYNRYDIK